MEEGRAFQIVDDVTRNRTDLCEEYAKWRKRMVAVYGRGHKG